MRKKPELAEFLQAPPKDTDPSFLAYMRFFFARANSGFVSAYYKYRDTTCTDTDDDEWLYSLQHKKPRKKPKEKFLEKTGGRADVVGEKPLLAEAVELVINLFVDSTFSLEWTGMGNGEKRVNLTEEERIRAYLVTCKAFADAFLEAAKMRASEFFFKGVVFKISHRRCQLSVYDMQAAVVLATALENYNAEGNPRILVPSYKDAYTLQSLMWLYHMPPFPMQHPSSCPAPGAQTYDVLLETFCGKNRARLVELHARVCRWSPLMTMLHCMMAANPTFVMIVLIARSYARSLPSSTSSSSSSPSTTSSSSSSSPSSTTSSSSSSSSSTSSSSLSSSPPCPSSFPSPLSSTQDCCDDETAEARIDKAVPVDLISVSSWSELTVIIRQGIAVFEEALLTVVVGTPAYASILSRIKNCVFYAEHIEMQADWTVSTGKIRSPEGRGRTYKDQTFGRCHYTGNNLIT